MSPRRGRLESP